MLILLAGASGLIGQHLEQELTGAGHQLRRLVRRPAVGVTEVQWAPERGELPDAALADVEAVIGLSGAGIADHRWNGTYKQLLRDSRIQPTQTLVRAIERAGDHAPHTFLNASAVGYYGNGADALITEQTPVGAGFLARLCQDWEAAAQQANSDRTRVVPLRTGLVLAAGGGLLGRLKPIVQLGGGGKLGSGQQFYPWISLRDHVRALRWILEHGDVRGPANLTGPDPVRNATFMKRLAAQLHRPSVVPTPSFALRLALGEFADEGVLVGQNAVPEELLRSGFTFTDRTVDDAFRYALS